MLKAYTQRTRPLACCDSHFHANRNQRAAWNSESQQTDGLVLCVWLLSVLARVECFIGIRILTVFAQSLYRPLEPGDGTYNFVRSQVVSVLPRLEDVYTSRCKGHSNNKCNIQLENTQLNLQSCVRNSIVFMFVPYLFLSTVSGSTISHGDSAFGINFQDT